jgi:hypothetical protein
LLGRTKGEISDDWHRRLLRARRARPSSSRATEQRDKLASLHSITSSASESKLSLFANAGHGRFAYGGIVVVVCGRGDNRKPASDSVKRLTVLS